MFFFVNVLDFCVLFLPSYFSHWDDWSHNWTDLRMPCFLSALLKLDIDFHAHLRKGKLKNMKYMQNQENKTLSCHINFIFLVQTLENKFHQIAHNGIGKVEWIISRKNILIYVEFQVVLFSEEKSRKINFQH